MMRDYLKLPARPQAEDHTSPLHCWTLPNGGIWCLIHRMPDGYRMRFPNLADFHVTHAGQITAIPVPGTDAPTLEHLFANQVLPAALSLQHRPVFHASALSIDGAAVGFLGQSGRGKSTLATYLASRGHPLLTDDGLELREADGNILAIPNRPSVRLWQDSRTALLPTDIAPMPGVSYTHKQRFDVRSLLPLATSAAPLRAAFFLGDGSAREPTITHLTPSQAHLAWIRHAFMLDVHDKQTLARQFRLVARLATAGLSYQLDYPREYGVLAQVESILLATLSPDAHVP